MDSFQCYSVSPSSQSRVTSWAVSTGDKVRNGTVLLTYELLSNSEEINQTKEGVLKSTVVGIVENTMFEVGEVIPAG